MSVPQTLREELVRYYRWLRVHGLNDSHSGNASVRDGDRVLVTPSGCCADTLGADDLLECPVDGPPAPGSSLDAPLHLAVYRAAPGATAVLHSHGVHTLALTLPGGDFRPVDFEGQYYFPTVPVIDIPYADYVDTAPDAVSAALASHRVAVVRGHGIYARGATLDEAYKWTCSLEHSARIAWLAGTHGASR